MNISGRTAVRALEEKIPPEAMKQYFSEQGCFNYVRVGLSYENDNWSICPQDAFDMLDSEYWDWNISVRDAGSTVVVSGYFKENSSFSGSETWIGQDARAYRALDSETRNTMVLATVKFQALVNWLRSM